jgi:iron complex outermembrane receptor protein
MGTEQKSVASSRTELELEKEKTSRMKVTTMRVGRGGQWSALLVGGLMAAQHASAQTEDAGPGSIEEIVSVGTRRAGRTSIETPVPVDVFDSEQLERVPGTDTTDIISSLVPSFDVGRQPISDGATFIRPPQLRGLDSDKSLVLVNGKRRHRAALVVLGGFGSHGPDLATIPPIAIGSVEVLRDGAAAQYGSDAIAGVLNFNLRDEPSGGNVAFSSGEYGERDGSRYKIAGNIGLPLTANGFLNLSAEYSKSDRTSRGGLYDLPIQQSGEVPSVAAAAGNADVPGFPGLNPAGRYGPDAFTEMDVDGDGVADTLVLGSDGIRDDTDMRYADNLTTPEQRWGQPDQEAIRTFLNAGVDLSDTLRVYGFANYSKSEANGDFFHRRPGVSQLYPLRLEDGSIYDPRDLYPAGFTPEFFGDVTDYSAVGGVQGTFGKALGYDFSARYGHDDISYKLENTLNPSLGPTTPTVFHPGTLTTEEYAVNADFSRDFAPEKLGGPMTVAFGVEYRDESYVISRGDPLSYAVGPFARIDPFDFEITQAEADADPNDALTQVECRIPGLEVVGSLCPAGDPINNAVPVGSNGFPGYSPDFTSDFSRDSIGTYAEVDVQVTERALLDAAARFEDFSDFGSHADAKLSGRYVLDRNGDYAFRASIGTGFRAPTPGQISTTNVSTRIDPNGQPVAEGIFPATNPASQLFGALPLEPEESVQWTAGFTMQPLDRLTLTLDYYRIDLDHRLVLSSQFTVGPDEVAVLEALGVPGANTIGQVRFFTNDLNSTSEGIDLVTTYTASWGSGASTQFSLSANFNNTEITSRTPRYDAAGNEFFYVNDETVFDEENGLPSSRAIFSVMHAMDPFSVFVRANYYGSYENANNASLSVIQKFSPKTLVDLELNWDVTDAWRLTVGGQNVFDKYPDPASAAVGETCCGRIYRSDSIVPWQGSFWYLRASAAF